MNARPLMLVITMGMGAVSMTAAGQTADPATAPSVPAANSATTSRDAGTIAPQDTLKARVKSAMASHYNLASLNINVVARKGVVHLSGTVPSGVQIDQAESVVSDVEGVKEVDNQLKASGG